MDRLRNNINLVIRLFTHLTFVHVG